MRKNNSGFTLVEILIVVIILGILAAIVIPQFTNASQDARRSSLTSQLQTIRSQVALFQLQHRDALPTGLTANNAGAAAWAGMIIKTNDDQTVTGTPQFGPYLQAPPNNPLTTIADPASVQICATDPVVATATVTACGWVINTANGKIFATTKSGTKIFDENDLASAHNDL